MLHEAGLLGLCLGPNSRVSHTRTSSAMQSDKSLKALSSTQTSLRCVHALDAAMDGERILIASSNEVSHRPRPSIDFDTHLRFSLRCCFLFPRMHNLSLADVRRHISFVEDTIYAATIMINNNSCFFSLGRAKLSPPVLIAFPSSPPWSRRCGSHEDCDHNKRDALLKFLQHRHPRRVLLLDRRQSLLQLLWLLGTLRLCRLSSCHTSDAMDQTWRQLKESLSTR